MVRERGRALDLRIAWDNMWRMTALHMRVWGLCMANGSFVHEIGSSQAVLWPESACDDVAKLRAWRGRVCGGDDDNQLIASSHYLGR